MEDKYIELLEDRLEDLKSAPIPNQPHNNDIADFDVVEQVESIIIFRCPTAESTLKVKVKSLPRSKWMVSIRFDLEELDEFGFAKTFNQTFILNVTEGELMLEPLIKEELPCD